MVVVCVTPQEDFYGILDLLKWNYENDISADGG
jgi:hypothetical protein